MLKQSRNVWLGVVTLSALALCSPFASAAAAKAQDQMLELGPNALIDTKTNYLYSANPAGRAGANTLVDGREIWRSAEISLPVAVTADRVFALGASKAPGAGQLLVLDAKNGKVLQRLVLPLPEAVYAQPIPAPARLFSMRGTPNAGGLLLSWEYQSYALRGQLEEGPSEGTVSLSGALQIQLAADGQAELAAGTAESVAPRSTELFGAARIEGFPSRQFESVDAAFINGSVAQSDAHFGTAYAWQIVRRASEKAVGKITLPVSSAPFHVKDALIYVRLPASAAPDANGELQAGLNRVEAFDLSKQRSLYVIELMEPNYLGVMPP